MKAQHVSIQHNHVTKRYLRNVGKVLRKIKLHLVVKSIEFVTVRKVT